MFSFLRAKPASSIGLEINRDEIKLLQLSSHRQRYTIENYALAALPNGAIEDDKIKRADWVQSTLCRMVDKTRTAGRAAVVAIPSHHVIIKRLQLAAYLSEWECEVEIRANLQRYLPGITEELYFDFTLLPPTPAANHDILLVAARTEQVCLYTELISSAGLSVNIVDVDVYAWLRGVSWSLGSALVPGAVVALCDIGRLVARLIVFQDQHMLFAQHWETQDFPAWEKQVMRELQRFSCLHRQLQVDVLVLSGEMPEACELLTSGLAASIQVVNPFNTMSPSALLSAADVAQMAPRFPTCCGLALRGLS